MTTAPYNFVPLPGPEGWYTTADDDGCPWRHFDQVVPGTHSGWLDVTAKTLTPLFIRGPQRDGDDRENRLRESPWLRDGRPVIPGESMRGMLLTMVEIITWSAISNVSRERKGFRAIHAGRGAPAPGSVQEAYMIRLGTPKAGFLTSGGVIPTTYVLLAPPKLPPYARPDYESEKASYQPAAAWQHRSCWVQHDGVRVTKIAWSKRGPGWYEGVLVLSGWSPAPNKPEHVFLIPTASTAALPVDNCAIAGYRNQRTPWQDEANLRGKVGLGADQEGRPVFYTENKGRVSEFGRPRYFRLGNEVSPSQLVAEVATGRVDLARAMFGRVGDRPITSRLRVGELQAAGKDPVEGWLLDPFVPLKLLEPKPESYKMYLDQPPGHYVGYTANQSLRGHKLYWHRWDETHYDDVKRCSDAVTPDQVRNSPEQHKTSTIIQPVRSGVSFEGRIWFTNLLPCELGALLTAVRLAKGSAHKLGMGKPLGLGSVRLEASVHLVERAERWKSWAATGEVTDGEKTATESVAYWKKVMRQHAEDSYFKSRMAELSALVNFENRPPFTRTAQMAPVAFRNARLGRATEVQRAANRNQRQR